jgi:LPXTG-motif cell wall-anchored protein
MTMGKTLTGTAFQTATALLLSGALLAAAALTAFAQSTTQTFSGIRLTSFNIAGAPSSVRAGATLVFNASAETNPHNLAIDANGTIASPTNPNIAPGTSGQITLTAPATPGTYVLFCPVGQHRTNGMQVPITVVAGASALPATGGHAVPSGLALAGVAAGALGLLLRRRRA